MREAFCDVYIMGQGFRFVGVLDYPSTELPQTSWNSEIFAFVVVVFFNFVCFLSFHWH